jgi:hypothetical protein
MYNFVFNKLVLGASKKFRPMLVLYYIFKIDRHMKIAGGLAILQNFLTRNL